MKCAVCKKPMIVLEIQEVEVDFCLECSGTWLDRGELEELLEDPKAVAEFYESVAAGGKIVAGDRKCPICRKRMEKIHVGPKGRIELDRCRKGHGIWFEKGELEEVIETFGHEGHSGRVGGLLRNLFGAKGPKGQRKEG